MQRLFAIILTLVLTIFVITACGNNSNKEAESNAASDQSPRSSISNNAGENSVTGNFNPIVVKSSELISEQDAERILGCDIEVDELDKVDTVSGGSNKSIYKSKDDMMYYLSMYVASTAALNPEKVVDRVTLMEGGIKSYNDNIYESRASSEGAVELEGDWDWAVVWKQNIDIAYSDYSISIFINTAASKVKHTDEERIAQLTEAGTLAFERLTAIVDA